MATDNMAVNAEATDTGANGATDSWKRYDLHEGIKRFCDAMKKGEAFLTREMKQKVVNLGWGTTFDGISKTETEYSNSVAPWFVAMMSNFPEEMKAACREFMIVDDIAYSRCIKTKDRYGLSVIELRDIRDMFRAAEKGEFKKPRWIPPYCDTIDKAKAFVFAFMEDINYHGESKLLQKGVEFFAEFVDLLTPHGWDGYDRVKLAMLMEKAGLVEITQ